MLLGLELGIVDNSEEGLIEGGPEVDSSTLGIALGIDEGSIDGC
jgi:hypothetical protein